MGTPFVKRTWIDIDLDVMIDNYREACRLTDATVTCVVKSNGYGHGAVTVAQTLQSEGCKSFAVSCAREALELRAHGINGQILVMGLTEPEILPYCVEKDITLTLGDVEGFCDAQAAAEKLGMKVKAHVKLDTGFHRLGFDCTEQEADLIAANVKASPNVRIEGMYSHLGLITPERDRLQHSRLVMMQQLLSERGISISDIHICDSIGLVRYPEFHHSRVRVGAMLYGVRPYKSENMPFRCGETLCFRTTVAQVRHVAAGEIIGYSDDQILDHDAVIATLCVGYGDGYPRHLSNGKGQVSIRGQLALVFGVICMDQMMVDVTGIPGVAPGDTVDLLGGDIRYQQYSDMCRNNRNECITILSRRPIRVYHKGGSVVKTEDQLLSGGLL